MKITFVFLVFTMLASSKLKPGNAIYILQNGVETYLKINGAADIENEVRADAQTNYRMASVSKQFTAACIILLKNEGKLDYHDKLSKFFPDFKEGEKVTLTHLLTHSSGIKDYEDLIPNGLVRQVTDADVLKWVGSEGGLYFTPGTDYRYSNSAFCILTQVVEKVSGMSYSDFIKEYIFRPLNMDYSYIYEGGTNMQRRAKGYALEDKEILFSDQSLTSATQGDGCVYTSLNDYKKWITAIGYNILFNLKNELNEVNILIPNKNGLKYGLGWFNYNDELYHTGSTSGFSNVVWMTMDGKNALVYFSNLADNHNTVYKYYKKMKFKKPSIQSGTILALTA